MRVRLLAVTLAAAASVLGVGCSAAPVPDGDRNRPVDPSGQVSGAVLDESGRPVAGGRVTTQQGATSSIGPDGRFTIPSPGGATLVTVTAPKHLTRTVAISPADPADVTLSASAGGTVSLRFGGDVMFGRRYYDQNEDGNPSDGLLKLGASAAEHASLLQQVQPLLADSDITAINLETPIVEDPWVDPTKARPARFHPTKDYAFASAPESLDALKAVGVDVVSLGNNHVYDVLQDGLTSTLDYLDAAAIPHFGAGTTVDAAWEPALLTRRGQTFAFLGCSTVIGFEHDIRYVASDRQGGAAQCERDRMQKEVAEAAARSDYVVVMMHGGEEYDPDQSEQVRDLTAVAQEAGAAMVINAHPHVVGGITRSDGRLAAETTGNLLFAQTVWPTFLSYLLRAEVRNGAVLSGSIDPLFLEGYIPRPAVGLLSDSASRRAAGLVPGESLLTSAGSMLLPPPGRRPRPSVTTAPLRKGQVARLAPGWWLGPQDEPGAVAAGEDLLWTGTFEDMDTDPATKGGHQWALGRSAALTGAAACSGRSGVQLLRGPVSVNDAVLTPKHRQLVTAGSRLSLLVAVGDASEGGEISLAWYRDTRGPSTSRQTVKIPRRVGEEGCATVRLDAVVPEGMVAAQPFVRLTAPPGNQRNARLSVDDVRLIGWAPAGATGRRYDTVEALKETAVTFTSDDNRGGAPPGPLAMEGN